MSMATFQAAEQETHNWVSEPKKTAFDVQYLDTSQSCN